MPQMNITTQQVAAAAAAGLELLADKDLKVPVRIAMSGQLGMLQSMLTALAGGEIVLANAPPPEGEVFAPKSPEGDTPEDSPEGVTPIKGKGS